MSSPSTLRFQARSVLTFEAALASSPTGRQLTAARNTGRVDLPVEVARLAGAVLRDAGTAFRSQRRLSNRQATGGCRTRRFQKSHGRPSLAEAPVHAEPGVSAALPDYGGGAANPTTTDPSADIELKALGIVGGRAQAFMMGRAAGVPAAQLHGPVPEAVDDPSPR